MKRISTLAALLCLAGSVLAQDAAKRVTYRTVAVPATRAVAEIAKASGEVLTAAPAMARDIVVVAAKDVPLEDLLARLAEATSGTWVPVEGGRRLQPDVARRTREAQMTAQRRLAAIRKEIADRVAALSKKQPATLPEGKEPTEAQMREQMEWYQAQDPGQRALTQLLRMLDPALIAAMQPGDRVVFSTQPTRMQRPMGGNAAAVVAQFVEAHNEQVKDVTPEDLQQEMPPGFQMPEWIRERMLRESRPIKEAGKALLVLERTSAFVDLTSVSLKLYDRTGRVVKSEDTQIYETDPMAMFADVRANNQAAAPSAGAPAKRTPIVLSENTKEFEKLFSGMMGMNMQLTLNIKPEFREVLTRPDLHDPLGFRTSDSLLALADLQGRPLVAVVPDSMGGGGMSGMFRRREGETVESFLAELRRSTSVTLSEANGWLTVVPKDPAETRKDRMNREAVAELLQAVEKNGTASLDDLARFATKVDNVSLGQGQEMSYLMLFVPGIFSFSNLGNVEWDLLRFHATLNPMQRRGAAEGIRIPFSSLSPVQKALTNRMAFGANARLQVQRGDKPTEADPFQYMMSMVGMSGDVDFRDEPTELMPNGLPPDGYLELRGEMGYVAAAVPPSGEPMAFFAAMGADELAMFRMLREDKNLAAVAGMLPNFDRLRVGQRTEYSYQFHLAPRVTTGGKLLDTPSLRNAPIVAANQLPAAFNRRIDERLAALKKSPLGMAGSFMGGRPVTPP